MRFTAHYFTVLAALFALVGAVQAQVDASLELEFATLRARAGDSGTAKLTVTIAPSWHIASTTQPDGGPVRTVIALAEKQPFKFAGPITGPKPHVEHSEAFGINVETHEGTVVFTLPLEATENIKPGTKLTIEITYQTCNEETCLLPKTEKVSCIIGESKPAADKTKPPAANNP